MSTPAPLLELRELRRSVRLPSREDLHILRGIDLTVHAGDHVAVVGRSGSGKSTLLNLLGLIDRQTSGELLFDGADVSRLGDRRRARLR
ncbi:MAG: ATP-binding cassette domain-containing protein, partial [Brachybacterium tyrofermentans]